MKKPSQARGVGVRFKRPGTTKTTKMSSCCLAETLTSTTLSADTISYFTLLPFRLKLKCQDSNRPNHAKIPPALDPGCVTPGKPLAIWAELRPQAKIFSIIFYLSFTSTESSISYPLCQAFSLLAGLSHSLDESVGGRRNAGLAVAEAADKTSLFHAVNPVWRNIIPEAELKSVLTPPALAPVLYFFPS